MNKASLRIQSGEADVVLIVGAGEFGVVEGPAERANGFPYTEQADVEPGEILGKDVTMSHPVELERGFAMPINFYPIFESAFRASRGESISDHGTESVNCGKPSTVLPAQILTHGFVIL